MDSVTSNFDIKVSVIIPVYKVEKYLEKCVESVLNQTYTNLEIILVDDGSPDNCPAICDKYAEKDQRIKVIHKSNAGVANARNTGIKAASGAYLYFIDSDDMIFSFAIELLLNRAIETKCDMVFGDNIVVKDWESSYENPNITPSNDIIMNMDEALRFYADKEWAPWNRLIKSTIHKDIFFPDYKIHEDEALKFKLLSRCNYVMQCDLTTYMYRQRDNSITSSIDTPRIDMFISRENNYYWLENNYPEICPYFLLKVVEDSLYNIEAIYSSSCYDFENLNRIYKFLKSHRKKILLNKKISWAAKIRVIVFTISKIHKKNCFYFKSYSLLNKIRGK